MLEKFRIAMKLIKLNTIEGTVKRYVFETDSMQRVYLDYIEVGRDGEMYFYSPYDENQEPIILYRSKSNTVTLDLSSEVLNGLLGDSSQKVNITNSLQPNIKIVFERCLERVKEIKEEGLEGLVTDNLEDVPF